VVAAFIISLSSDVPLGYVACNTLLFCLKQIFTYQRKKKKKKSSVFLWQGKSACSVERARLWAAAVHGWDRNVRAPAPCICSRVP